ncbi:D-3-phosphoglycerate dehydrogenase [Candidatus Moduliflexus flocculans]|uniref:D-3-phosphoglycerate dehydrogenase n=1 Tax=Candidatus Moduliflexus flocculans TaxID=1499966 RepID=A0A0S6VX46_9BACT|nr:D-3-phosphoglycerate dehydrogenase [Candidatus Moduliflexus flocculans]
MKLLGIGDLFIPAQYIAKPFEALAPFGVETHVVDWQLESFDQLQAINLKVEQGGSDAVEPPAEIVEQARDAEIIITHFCTLTKRLVDACPKLKAIGVLRAGYENVNVAYAKEKGILVFNTPGRNADAVADFTIGVMIAECRNIAKGHHGLKNGEWIRTYPNYRTIPDLPGRTVGLVGLGEIGLKVAKRAKGFDMEVVGYDPYAKPEVVQAHGIKLVSLDELLKESDFVSMHARLTADNRHLIGEREFGLMKPTSYFINTARAGLVDEDALYQALKSGTIAGAAIDVFEKEPPGEDHPLVTLDNITITPHMAGGSVDAFYNSPKRLVADMINLFQDQSKIRFLLNRDRLSAWERQG